jgi:uncharacterized alpha-E superfamily protein
MMPRTQGWWWYLLGRYLERADNTSRIIDVKYFMILPSLHQVGSALDIIQWASVLRSCSAFEAFRRTKRGRLSLERVVDYLLRSEDFPRSVFAAVIYAQNCLSKITKELPISGSTAAEDELQALHDHLISGPVADIIANGLHEYLDDVQLRLAKVHAIVLETFIDYDPTPPPAE